jgi:uncharacterized protein
MNEYEVINQAKVTKSALKSRLMHPISKKKFAPRYISASLEKYATDFFTTGNEPRMFGLSGLRGTGKTTLLWQLAEHIYQKYSKEIYFFNVNTLENLGISLFQALEYFQTNIIKKRFNTLTKPIVFLFDEVHDDPKWSKVLKILYDEARTAFVIATGSSALQLQSTADLATRMLIKHIYPLSFSEYLGNILGMNRFVHELPLSKQLKDILIYSPDGAICYEKLLELNPIVDNLYAEIDNLVELIDNYTSFHNIPRVSQYALQSDIMGAIQELFKRVILEDIPKIAKENSNYIHSEKLLLRLSVSDEINVDSLSQAIGIKKEEILQNVDILSKAELINVLFPFGGVDTKLNKAKKAFFMSPSVRRALLTRIYGENISNEFKAKLLEDLIVMYLKRILAESILSFVSQKGVNADFVIETMDKPILLEIGLNKTTTRQIHKSNIAFRYGLIVNAQITAIEWKDNVIMLPLRWFLLL